MNVNIDPRVYNDVYFPFLYEQARTQIFFGGSSSGKSVFLAQRDIGDLLTGGRNFLIVRNTANTLRQSVFNEINKVIYDWNISRLFSINKSEMTITGPNGFQIIFKGLDDVEKIKSITPRRGFITDIRYEEASEISYDNYKALNKRLRGIAPDGKEIKKRVTFSFNPIFKSHWIYPEFFQGRFGDNDKIYKDSHLLILKTTYKDNKFLAKDDIYALENETDEYYYNVYTLGNWGVLGNVIFKNWRVEDLTEIKNQFSNYKNGLDFGFTNDPTCFVRTAKKENIIYITHGFYEYGLDNPAIAGKILQIAPLCAKNSSNERVKCDSSEPKSIKEIRDCGVNAVSAIKGPGSVNYGIQFLKRHTIIIDKSQQGIINDFTLYQWRKNKDGIVTNEPIDKNNHAPDGARYAYGDEINTNTETGKLDPRKMGIYM